MYVWIILNLIFNCEIGFKITAEHFSFHAQIGAWPKRAQDFDFERRERVSNGWRVRLPNAKIEGLSGI